MEAASVIAWKPLGELLVERGLITPRDLDAALAAQVENGRLLGTILVERKMLSGAVLTALLAEQAGVELEIEPGFGSCLFAKLATRGDAEESASASPSRHLLHEARLTASLPPSPAEPSDDPAFELIRLRSELELAHARIAELEQALASRPERRTRKRSVPAG